MVGLVGTVVTSRYPPPAGGPLPAPESTEPKPSPHTVCLGSRAVGRSSHESPVQTQGRLQELAQPSCECYF